jgi:hypothetical protein
MISDNSEDSSNTSHSSRVFHIDDSLTGNIYLFLSNHDGAKADAIIYPKTAALLRPYLKKGLFLDSYGYLSGPSRVDRLHVLLMNTDTTLKTSAADYWGVSPFDLHIGHLNSNRLDCNLGENISWIPGALNSFMRKSQPYLMYNGKYHANTYIQGKTLQ